MSGKTRVFVGIVLAVFLFESVAVTYTMGIDGIFAALTANYATELLAADLIIALSMIGVWMWRDARERGVNPFGYLILMALMGSVSPLLYLLRRGGEEAPARDAERARAEQPA